MNSQLTIHKQNSILKGYYRNYSLYDMRFLNALYYKVQRNADDFKDTNITNIRIREFRELMNLGNISNYSQIINKCLNQAKNKFYVEDYTDENEVKHKTAKINFIIGFKKSRKFKNAYEIKVHQDLIFNASRKKEWTELEFNVIQEYSTKRAMRLHEYLLSIYNLQNLNKKYNKKFYLEDFNNVFLSKHTFYSKVLEYLKIALKHIEKKNDLKIEFEINKMYQFTTFTLNKKDKSSQKIAIKANTHNKLKVKDELTAIENTIETAKNRAD